MKPKRTFYYFDKTELERLVKWGDDSIKTIKNELDYRLKIKLERLIKENKAR